MKQMLEEADFKIAKAGYVANEPQLSSSLHARCYTEKKYLAVEQHAIFQNTWQWACHEEKLRETGSYYVKDIAGHSILLLRNGGGDLRAFYNVCQHRAHELLQGEGKTQMIVCPYHAWCYDLDGGLRSARHTEHLEEFNQSEIFLSKVQVEEFCGFIYVNLDLEALSLTEQSGGLAKEIGEFAPDVNALTFAHRLTFDIKSNWKNIVDNFLECYHCPTAHKDFCTLLEFETYKVTTHGIYSSHMAKGGNANNSAYSTDGATVDDHAVWWLWPNTCLMRYPGRGNFLVLNVIPVGPNRTIETYDFFFETNEPSAQEVEAISYIEDVLQQEDIDLVESIQRGMETPAFDYGRIVHDPAGSGLSEHGVHHFHGLVLDAYAKAVAK
jgi:choline monooxygenase